MPELPEVEVTMRGILPILTNTSIKQFIIRNNRLREIVSEDFCTLRDLDVIGIFRRGKYIVIETNEGDILLHLGMTGNLKIINHLDGEIHNYTKHDHIDIVLANGYIIRFNDKRKFGLFLWYKKNLRAIDSKWLKNLGPEPLSNDFTSNVLFNLLNKKKTNIKVTLMNSQIVVGIGNIYASEILFETKISPFRLSNTISLPECEKLVSAIKEILLESIKNGGTTISDFSRPNGLLGYYVTNLSVYGHENEPCPKCGTPISCDVLGGRSTFYCKKCQQVN